MPQDTENGVLHAEMGEFLTLSIDGDRYSGMLKQGENRFQVENSQGKQMEVLVRPLTGEDPPHAVGDASYAARFPHLHVGSVIADQSRNRVYECFAPLDRERYLTVETALFGNTGLSVMQRLVISLSLAAAGCELKEFLAGRALSRLSLDALLVEQESGTVKLDVRQLLEERPAEEVGQEYRRMRFYGLFPPECYEDRQVSPLRPEALRHLLAVLIFRTLTAADPLDGRKTLVAFPYRTEATLRSIYGNEAVFVCDPSGVNGTNGYIGKNVQFMLSRICPGLKQLFFTVFCEGIQAPERRPTAEQWLDNQKKMVNWMTSTEKGMLIPDLSTGNGASAAIRYLCTGNGTVVPITHNRVIFQYMLDPVRTPLREQVIGTIRVQKNGAELVFRDPSRESVKFQTSHIQIEGMNCTIEKEPWLRTAAGEGAER